MDAEIQRLLEAGGWITVPLVAVSLVLWFVASLRMLSLRRGFSGTVVARVANVVHRGTQGRPRGPVDRYLTGALTALERPGTCQHQLERLVLAELDTVSNYGGLLTGLVTVAPLLGLLGTVNGMIETFASMNGVALARAAEQTVAGGISVALISTQLGLVIGVPGLVAARLLFRLEQHRARELGQAHSVLIATKKVKP